MKHNSHQFHCGLKDGIPIGLGYLAVSFTFGIMARGAGLTTLQSVVMSFYKPDQRGTVCSAGNHTGRGPFMEMAIAQLIINLRYCLMSCSCPRSWAQTCPSSTVSLCPMELQTRYSAFPYAGPAS